MNDGIDGSLRLGVEPLADAARRGIRHHTARQSNESGQKRVQTGEQL